MATQGDRGTTTWGWGLGQYGGTRAVGPRGGARAWLGVH